MKVAWKYYLQKSQRTRINIIEVQLTKTAVRASEAETPRALTTSLFSHFEKLRINTFINYKNKIGEHWLPRIRSEMLEGKFSGIKPPRETQSGHGSSCI